MRNKSFSLLIVLICVFQTSSVRAQLKDEFRDDRKNMVRIQIAGSLFGRAPVKDVAVLEAMRKVPRHHFVPERIKEHAYSDRPLPIGNGQTISQPYIVGFMTEALQAKPGDTILEIGTGSGYQAAVLSEIVKQVYSIEIVSELGTRAAKTLSSLGYDNVEVRVGDGYLGWPKKGPFEGIIVTAAPDHIPQPLLEQLKPEGRLVIPVGPENDTQKLLVITKQRGGTLTTRVLMLVRFVPFTGENAEKGGASIKRVR